MNDRQVMTLEEIKAAAGRLVQAGGEVREKLRALTVQALTQRDLAGKEIREVLNAITEGVSLGASQRTEEVKAALTDALHGVDDALSHAADAMQLTINEVVSDAREFGATDIHQGLEDFKKLEATFLEIVGHVAESAGGLVRQEMTLIAENGKRIGTDTGAKVKAVSEDLGNRVRSAAHDAADVGKQAARVIGARVAGMASRKLGEIAVRLNEKAEQLKQK